MSSGWRNAELSEGSSRLRTEPNHNNYKQQEEGMGLGMGLGDSVGDDECYPPYSTAESDTSLNTSSGIQTVCAKSYIGGLSSSSPPSTIPSSHNRSDQSSWEGRSQPSAWMESNSSTYRVPSHQHRTPRSEDVVCSNIPLRQYQKNIAKCAVSVAHEQGCVVNLPTGSGKTNIAAAIALTELVNGAKRGIRAVVMIVPTRDLVTQQADVFHRLIANNPAVADLLDEEGLVKEIVVTFRLGGKSLQRVGGILPSATESGGTVIVPNQSRSKKGKLTSVIFVATAEVYNTHVQRTVYNPESFDITSEVPPLSITSTVFFDEVHHCGKKHPYATAARTIFEGGLDSPIPRIIGLSATLSYASVGFEVETTNLLAMMRCGSGQFRNCDQGDGIGDDEYEKMTRSFIFSRSIVQLEKQGYNHPGQVKSLSDNSSSITITAADNYMLDLRPHELWTDMSQRLKIETENITFEQMLRVSATPKKIHPLVSAAYMLVMKLERMVFSHCPVDGFSLNNKSALGEEAYKEALGNFEQYLADNRLLGGNQQNMPDIPLSVTEELKSRACHLRLVALYLHCTMLVRMVTVTRQQELETALRGFVLYWNTTTPSNTQQIFDVYFNGSSLPEVDGDVGKLLRKIKIELHDNQALGKFDELRDLLKEKIAETPKLRAIVFAENVAMCAIISKNLSASGDMRAEWYTSKNNAPYFNVARRSLTDQRNVLESFRNGETTILVGTTVLEEGIDVPEVKLTVHYTPPTNIVSMVQRQGRARESGSESILVDNSKLAGLQHNAEQYHKQQQHLRTHNTSSAASIDTHIAFAPPVGSSSSSTFTFETKQAFTANLQNFKDWLSSSEVVPTDQRPSSQIVNEMAQRLAAKSLGKVTQSVQQCQGVTQQQRFAAQFTIELRLDCSSVSPTTIHVTGDGLGKKKAVCNAANEAIKKIQEALF